MIKFLKFIWSIIKSEDGRQIMIWVSKNLITVEYATELYLDGRLTMKRVKLPEWIL